MSFIIKTIQVSPEKWLIPALRQGQYKISPKPLLMPKSKKQNQKTLKVNTQTLVVETCHKDKEARLNGL